MKVKVDRKRTEVVFQVGDFVFVKLQPYQQHSVRLQRHQKLSIHYFDPFKVLERIGNVAYKLELPSDAKIHPVFHVSLLKLCQGDPVSQYIPLPPISSSGGSQLQPIVVLDTHKVLLDNSWIPQLLIQWEGSKAYTWEALSYIQE